jgi:type II secretory pathway pseudopilin PulG
MKTTRGFTIWELLFIVLLLALIVGIVLPATTRTCGGGSKQLKCSTQVRNIVQAMQVFANANKEQYPLPSLVDANNTTVADQGDAKNTTGNILSILIYNASISTELCVSPQEVSNNIKVYDQYYNEKPIAAVNPAKALWDPAFSADFTAKSGGHTSYANLQPSADRRSMWSNTFSATEPVFANRSPQIASVDAQGNPASFIDLNGKIVPKPDHSNTLLIHGPRTTWEGNIGYNDGHVNTEVQYTPTEMKVLATSTNGKKTVEQRDCPFFDEPAHLGNAFLGIFTKASTEREAFKGIWD